MGQFPDKKKKEEKEPEPDPVDEKGRPKLIVGSSLRNKGDGKDDNKGYSAGQTMTTTSHGRMSAPDLEYGQTGPAWGGPGYGGVVDEIDNPEGLAVAVAVAEEDEDQMYFHAIEYDPDAKPPMVKNRRFQLYGCFAFLFVVGGILIAVVAVMMTSGGTLTLAPTSSPTVAPTTSAEGLYREQFANVVGDSVYEAGTPAQLASEWIIRSDPLGLSVVDNHLIQRYLLALFYFETSRNGPWRSCNPPEGDETSACEFLKFTRNPDQSVSYVPEPDVRWLSDKHECEWVGVLCDETNTIRVLEVWGQNITGSLPTTISTMPFLQSISLGYNDFTGSLPVEYSQMRYLIALELQGNMLTGTVPDEYWRAQALQLLSLQENMLSGSISTEIGTLTDLRGMHFGYNMFNGFIPSEIGRLGSLSFTRFNENDLTGPFPTEIGGLGLLSEAWFQDNAMTGLIPTQIGNLKRLGKSAPQ